MQTTRRLIVSGDDFGAAPEVNAGIAAAHRDGILTSASLMVTGDAVDEAVALAREMPSLAVGLHLVLAQGRPAAPPETISRLVGRGGAFRDTPVLNGFWYFFNYFSRIGRAQLVREVTAQLDAFVATGLELSHVDGHLNMHLHPTMLPILIELAPRYGIRAVRLSREPLGPALRHDRRHALRKAGEGVVFHTLAAYGAPRLRAAGIRTVDRVYGMHQTGHIDERYVLSLLRDLPAGVSELYGHPATGQAAAMAHQQPGYDHPGEVAALTSPRVRDVVRAAGIELITHRDL